MSNKIVEGDLITAEVDVIVQQCNCITKTAHGLSQTIKDAFNVDPYGHRRLAFRKKNCAIKEDWGPLGQAILYDRDPDVISDDLQTGSVKTPKLKNTIGTGGARYVGCLFSQWGPGKPGVYHQELLKGEIDPISMVSLTDSAMQRENWFRSSLDNLADIIRDLNKGRAESEDKKWKIALPYLIGCGLAGGNWKNYQSMIQTWSDKNKDIMDVIIICKK